MYKENKKLVNFILYLLLHVFFLIIILSCIFFYVVIPVTRDSWDYILSLINYQVGTEVRNRAIAEPNNNLQYIDRNSNSSDDDIKYQNEKITTSALTFTTEIAVVVFTIIFILCMMYKGSVKRLFIRAFFGILTVSLVYISFSYFFIQNYVSMNMYKATQNFLRTVNNSLVLSDDPTDGRLISEWKTSYKQND